MADFERHGFEDAQARKARLSENAREILVRRRHSLVRWDPILMYDFAVELLRTSVEYPGYREAV